PDLLALSLHDALPILAGNPEQVMQVQGAFTELVAFLHLVAALHPDTGQGRQSIVLLFAFEAPDGDVVAMDGGGTVGGCGDRLGLDRKSTRLNSSHDQS